MLHPKNANQAIIVRVGLPMLRNANQDHMPQLKDRRLVYFVHREEMLQIMVQLYAIFAVTINTNPNPMLQNAFQWKKVIIVLVLQQKWNAHRVKQALVVMQHVKRVVQECFKVPPGIQHVLRFKVVITNRAPQPKWFVQPVKQAMVAMQRVKNVFQECFKVHPVAQHVVFAQQDDMRQARDQLHALIVHLARMRVLILLLNVPNVATMNTSQIPLLPNVVRFKAVITVLEQQPKWFVQPVKREVVETQRVANVYKDGIKIYQVRLNATNARPDMATMQMVQQHAMVYLQDPTVWMVK
jgi:hypothetical protein